MASKTVIGQIQFRRDTAHNWAVANPVLLAGELGFETDTRKGKVGDGTTTWNNLPYAFQMYSVFVGSGSSAAEGLVPKPSTTEGTTKYLREDASWKVPPDTKNTAGSTNDTSKLFLVGAKSQAANPQTYSHSNVYETNGTLTASSFTGNLNGDNYIQWGGPSIAAAVSPTDAGCIDDFGHNKAAFWNGLIDVEYTTNGGTSWTDYGLTDDQKWALVTTGGYAVVVGKRTAVANNGGSLTNSNVANYRARITLHTRDASKNGKFYTAMRKLLLNVSTSGAGGSTVKVTGRTIGNYNNNADTWNDLGSFSVSGWSGWNSIPMNITFGGGSTQTGQYADLRLEFWATSVSTSSASTLTLLDIRIIGVTNWTVDSFAATGHMYTYDRSKNVTFPAKVTATEFSGKITGNVMTGYTKPSSTSAIAATDTLNAAIGKLEKALDGKQAAPTSACTAGDYYAKNTVISLTVTLSNCNKLLFLCGTDSATEGVQTIEVPLNTGRTYHRLVWFTGDVATNYQWDGIARNAKAITVTINTSTNKVTIVSSNVTANGIRQIYAE